MRTEEFGRLDRTWGRFISKAESALGRAVMEPIDFQGQTMVLAADQPEYQPLPVQMGIVDAGQFHAAAALSCWQLSDQDIETLLKTRKLWLLQLTFGNTLQPQLPSVERPEFLQCFRPQSSSPRAAKGGDE